jgi:hypothetical protein
MKATFLIAITIFLFACSTQESSISKQLDDYIKLNVDNPKTYESVETRTAELSDLFDSPEINVQFVNVENVLARIYYILSDIHEYAGLYMPDTIIEQIVEIKKIIDENGKFSFENMAVCVDKVSELVFESITLLNTISSNNRNFYLENTVQYEEARNRLKLEYSRLYSTIQDKIGITDYTGLVSTIESNELVVHKYRIEENGSVRLKGELFLMKDLKVIRSIPM